MFQDTQISDKCKVEYDNSDGVYRVLVKFPATDSTMTHWGHIGIEYETLKEAEQRAKCYFRNTK